MRRTEHHKPKKAWVVKRFNIANHHLKAKGQGSAGGVRGGRTTRKNTRKDPTFLKAKSIKVEKEHSS